MAWATRPDDARLNAVISSVILDMQKSGELASLQRKHLGVVVAIPAATSSPNLEEPDMTIHVNKRAIALFLASTLCGAAYAQSAVTIYGLMDVGISRYTTAQGSVLRVSNNEDTPSRLGFKGTEDLGAGFRRFFGSKQGVRPDTGHRHWRRRCLFIQSGKLRRCPCPLGQGAAGQGVESVGRSFAVYRFNNYAAFIFPEFANFDRFYSNSIKYTSPVWHGLSGMALYSLGETAGSTKAASAGELGLSLETGPTALYATYNVTENAQGRHRTNF